MTLHTEDTIVHFFILMSMTSSQHEALFILSPAKGHCGCFLFGTFMNNADINVQWYVRKQTRYKNGRQLSNKSI